MNWQKLNLVISILWIVGLEPVCARDLEERFRLIDFEQETWDRNLDKDPDDWKRTRGPGFPDYIDIKIDDPPVKDERWGEGSLHIELDGGSAEISSPKTTISPEYSIVLEGWTFLKPSKQNEVNEAWVSVTLMSEDGKAKETFKTLPIRDQEEWTRFKLGPIEPSESHTQLEVRLHFGPTRNQDLFGEAWFDNIRLSLLPKLSVKTGKPFNVFEKPEDVEVKVNVSGTKSAQSEIHLELRDVDNHVVDEHTIVHRSRLQASNPIGKISTQPVVYSTRRLSWDTGEQAAIFAKTGKLLNEYAWSPEIKLDGYYKLLVKLKSPGQTDVEEEISMAVMPPLGSVNTKPFGWNLPRQPETVPLQDLVKLTRESGVHWLAYPVWFAEKDLAEASRVGDLAERLTLGGMELIAVIDQPPEQLQSQFDRYNQGIASLLQEDELWKSALDPVLTRLSFKVDWWQLGSFDDYSFVNYPDLKAKMVEVHDHLSRFGKNIKIGITWNWLYRMELDPDDSLDYLLRATKTPMTGQEILTNLKNQGDSPAPLWATLQPLDRSDYNLSTRARDLVERMTVGKISGASAILIPQPISTESGVLNDEMHPTELLLPWQLTARELAGTEYIGQLDLPNDSENYVFKSGDKVTMLIWRDQPIEEMIDLGDDVQTMDCWGRDSSSFRSAETDTLDVTPTPQFVTGLKPNLVEWQINCRFVDPHIDSIIGRKQQGILEFKNTYTRGVFGTVTLTSNQLWEVPQVLPFKVNPGATFSAAVDFQLPANINAGRHEVKIEFNLSGADEDRITLYRDLNVGSKGLRIETGTQLKGGQLLVHVTLINESTEEADVSLDLFAPDRRRKRLQVVNVKSGRVQRTFAVDNAAQLRGGMVLRAKELKGEHTLNYRIPVEEPRAAQE